MPKKIHEETDKTRKYSKYENGRWRVLGVQSINTESFFKELI